MSLRQDSARKTTDTGANEASRLRKTKPNSAVRGVTGTLAGLGDRFVEATARGLDILNLALFGSNISSDTDAQIVLAEAILRRNSKELAAGVRIDMNNSYDKLPIMLAKLAVHPDRRAAVAYQNISLALRFALAHYTYQDRPPKEFFESVSYTSGPGSSRLKADVLLGSTGPMNHGLVDFVREMGPILIGDPKGILTELQTDPQKRVFIPKLFAPLLDREETRHYVNETVALLAQDAAQVADSNPKAAERRSYFLGQLLGNIETALTLSAKADLAKIEKGKKIASYLGEGLSAVGRFVLKQLVLRPLASREGGEVDRKTAKLLAGLCAEAWVAFDRQLDPSGDRKRRLDSAYLDSLLAFYKRMSDGWLSVARHETEPIDREQIISVTEDALAAQSEVAHAGLTKMETHKTARDESEASLSEFNRIREESVVGNRAKESDGVERQNLDVSRPTSHSVGDARGTEGKQASNEVHPVGSRSAEGKGLGEIDIAAPAAKSIDQVLLSLRTEATRITRKVAEQDGRLGQTTSPTLFGDINHAVFRTLGKQAVEEGLLPSTMMFAPAPIRITGGRLSRGRTIDAWDSATGIGWDLTTSTVKSVTRHESYIGELMPDGTLIRDVRPLVYARHIMENLGF